MSLAVFQNPAKDPAQRFEDILENIRLIEEFTRGMNAASFLEDVKTRTATERCLERISEAAKKLDNLAEQLCPTIPWSHLRALGNLLRHEYDVVDPNRIWLMIEGDLSPLKSATERALEQLTTG